MVTWVRASVAAVLHSITSKLSLHDLIGTTICHFELCIEQKMENQRNFAKDGNFFKKSINHEEACARDSNPGL